MRFGATRSLMGQTGDCECSSGAVEDEQHFLVKCPKLNECRIQ